MAKACVRCCGILAAMPVTMLDIAKGLNVSVVTVSKVLRNQGKISAATRKRVLRRAKELNYQTNWIARSFRQPLREDPHRFEFAMVAHEWMVRNVFRHL